MKNLISIKIIFEISLLYSNFKKTHCVGSYEQYEYINYLKKTPALKYNLL